MPTYTKETALYDTGAIKNGIDGAANTAKSYITNVSNDGIFVHTADSTVPTVPETAGNDGVHISDDVDIIRNGEVVASYGDTAVIGKEDETQVIVGASKMGISGSDGTIFEVGDCIGQRNQDTYVGDGTTKSFFCSIRDPEDIKVYVDDVISSYTYDSATYNVTLPSAPADGSVVVIDALITHSIPYITSGSRKTITSPDGYVFGLDCDALGPRAFAIGESTTAQGGNSFAAGKGTIALGLHSVAIGAFNIAESNAVFSIGNGVSTNRKNAFAVYKNGKITVSSKPLLKTKTVVIKDGLAVNANTYATTNKAVNDETGYSPIGIVGVHLENATTSGTYNTFCFPHSFYISSGTAYFILKNTHASTNANVKLSATILYANTGII